ncbi:hypothetical protein LWI29_011949 [Acer saccharum]|uniref:Uncharacterized protein n=1 Tax=Acer saccharum TaxID=4024 RepID=A0AA39VPG9_ACESA|nr:hypothetical protein LWI29_011949 [Acer saccharum]
MKASDKAVPESMIEGESSKKIRALVNVPNEFLVQSDMAGEVGSLKMDTVMALDQGSMSAIVVMDPVSEYGPHLDSNKVSSNFNLSNSESLIGRSGSNSKRMVDKSSGVGKRISGRGLKLGISGEKFKVCGGKRKLDLVCTGDLVKDTKIRKKNEVIMEIGIQDGI